MRKQLFVALFLPIALVATDSRALAPRPADPQSTPIAIVGATAHLGNGEVIESAVVTFANGLITGVYDADSGMVDTSNHEVIDAKEHHLYPGFILPDSDLGLQEIGSLPDTVDHQERGEINPNVRSLNAYNTDSEITPTTRFNGILVAQISPNGGLVSGRSSIVELDAWGWQDAAMVADDGLHVNWPGKTQGEFDFATFSFRFVPNEDYDTQVGEIEKLFRDAAAYAKDDHRPATNLKLDALAGLFDGRQRLYLHADSPNDIVLAVRFARSLGIEHVIVVTADAALDVANFLAESSVPVLLAGVHRRPAQAHDAVDLPFRLPSLLLEKGLRVGMTYPSLMNARNLPFIAGTAAAHGLDPEQALRMITLSNAEILGIDSRVGSLEVGKHATLFISEGDALDMRGNQLRAAFIRGKRLELDGMQQKLYRRYRERYASRPSP